MTSSKKSAITGTPFCLTSRLRRRNSRKSILRYANSFMAHIDEMIEDQPDRALECISVKSSLFSIPSLQPGGKMKTLRYDQREIQLNLHQAIT